MDFVERLFGVSPDNGDGSFELVLLAFVIVAAIGALWIRWRKQHGRDAGMG
jgi:hypothetical protein